jgi:hypothetical protein
MKKRIILFPILLLASLVVFNWGCGEEEEKDEDLCQPYEEVPETCDIPTACCPTDGGNCYYIHTESGTQYTCTGEDCSAAIDAYIEAHCETAKLNATEINKFKIELSKFTRELLVQACDYSVCL